MGERGVLPASRNQTISEHLDATIERHCAYIPERGTYAGQVRGCRECGSGSYPCATNLDAVAALDLCSEIAPLLVDIHSRASRAYMALPLTARIERDDLAQSIQDVEAALGRLLPTPDPGEGAEHAPKEHP